MLETGNFPKLNTPLGEERIAMEVAHTWFHIVEYAEVISNWPLYHLEAMNSPYGLSQFALPLSLSVSCTVKTVIKSQINSET